MKKFILLLIAPLILSACKSGKSVTNEQRIEYVYVHDTIIREKITDVESQKWRSRYDSLVTASATREVIQHFDSIIIVKNDSGKIIGREEYHNRESLRDKVTEGTRVMSDKDLSSSQTDIAQYDKAVSRTESAKQVEKTTKTTKRTPLWPALMLTILFLLAGIIYKIKKDEETK